MGHLASGKKRKYRYARVMAAQALAAAKAAEKHYERRLERLGEYGTIGEELAQQNIEDVSKLTPFLQSILGGMYADPKMGPVSLKTLVGRKPELVQAGRKVEGPFKMPSVYAVRGPEGELAPGEDIASVRRIFSKRPEATLDLTTEEAESIMPIAERAAEWSGYRWPVATTGAQTKEYAETYNKKMGEYQTWSAVEARYRRKHAHEVSKWKRIATLAVAAIATVVSFGALGPIIGAVGGTAAGTAATAGAAGTGLVGAFGVGGLGTVLTTTALGAAGGAISGGWKGALIGGIAGLAGGLAGGAGAGGGAAGQAAPTIAREAGSFAYRMSPITGQLVSTGAGQAAAQAAGPLLGLGAQISLPTAGQVTPTVTGGLSGMLRGLAPYAKAGLSWGTKAYKSMSELGEMNEYMRRLIGEQYSGQMPSLPEETPLLPVTT